MYIKHMVDNLHAKSDHKTEDKLLSSCFHFIHPRISSKSHFDLAFQIFEETSNQGELIKLLSKPHSVIHSEFYT